MYLCFVTETYKSTVILRGCLLSLHKLEFQADHMSMVRCYIGR